MPPQVPLSVLPDCETLLVTSTPMYSGTVSGGFPLLPGRAVKVVPHSSGGLICGRVTPDAKPLNEDGAWPPERLFRLDHEWLHQVTVLEPAPPAVTSPRGNAPRLGEGKTKKSSPSGDRRVDGARAALSAQRERDRLAGRARRIRTVFEELRADGQRRRVGEDHRRARVRERRLLAREIERRRVGGHVHG